MLVEEVEELLLVLPDGQLDPLAEELEVARREGQRSVRVHLQEEDIMRTQFQKKMYTKCIPTYIDIGYRDTIAPVTVTPYTAIWLE